MILTLALPYRWSIQQIDIINAFLNGFLSEEIYMLQPPGFESADKKLVCKLNRALYGLKQAPRAWYERLTSVLLHFGFKSSRCDPSLFTYTTATAKLYVLVYVDDIIITGSSSELITKLIQQLNVTFALKELGELDYFLGIEVKKTAAGSVLLSQAKYIRELLSRADMLDANPINTPMISNIKLSQFGTDLLRMLIFIGLLLVACNMPLLLGLRLLIVSTKYVNLWLILLKAIGKLSSAFSGILKVLFLMDWNLSLLSLLFVSISVLIVMPIGQVILTTVDQPLGIVFILVRTWFLGVPRNKLLLLDPLLKRNIGAWPMLPLSYCGYSLC